MQGNFALCQMRVGSLYPDSIVCTLLRCLTHGLHKTRTTIGIYRVVSRMIGYHQTLQPMTLGYATSNRQHNAITERHHRRTHILIVITPFRDSISTTQQRRLKILLHKVQRHHDVWNSQPLTVHLRQGNLLRPMIRPIVERHRQGYFLSILI